MNDHHNVEVTPIELTDEELSAVSAGKPDVFTKLGDIEGETMTSSGRDWVEILCFKSLT